MSGGEEDYCELCWCDRHGARCEIFACEVGFALKDPGNEQVGEGRGPQSGRRLGSPTRAALRELAQEKV